jgi:tetratricopeptide (TPR) repeat protein
VNRDSDNILQEASELCNDEREQEAEILVKDQLSVDPNNLQLMTKLGEIQARLCRENEAEATLRNVLNRDPNYEDAVCFLGRLLDQSLRVEEAERVYREFLQNNPTGHHALDDLCRFLLSENRIDEALELARNQVEKYSDQHDAYSALTNVLHILEDESESYLDDDQENKGLFTEYMNNLLEQLELVFKLETHIDITEDLLCEVEDEKSRLSCEIDQLLKSAGTRNISLSSDFEDRIKSTLQNLKTTE